MFNRKLQNGVGGNPSAAVPATALPKSPPAIPAAAIPGSEATKVPAGKSALPEGVAGAGVVLVGKGIKMTGEISDCALVEIQGLLEGSIVAESVIIREGGGFAGSLQTDRAEVHGLLQGTVVVHDLLDIRSTGQVQGEMTYGKIAIEVGGFLSGNLQNKGEFDSEIAGTAVQAADAAAPHAPH